jgi:hypothetical protein
MYQHTSLDMHEVKIHYDAYYMLIQRLKQPGNDIDVYIQVSIFAITQHKSSSRVQIKGKHILSSHK